MTEVFGYKDSSGKFWDTKEEAKIADLKAQLRLAEANTIGRIHSLTAFNHPLSHYKNQTDTKVKDVVWSIPNRPPFTIKDFLHYILEYPEIIQEYAREVSKIEKELHALQKTESENSKWWKFW